MQLIIPMSGFGERFRKAGYDIPKFMIELNGKPIIEHVLDMYPGIERVIFVCNKEHLECERYQVKETLLKLRPKGEVLSIDPHSLGPVHAVLQASDLIDDTQPIVANYCDFTCYWDFEAFTKFVETTGCDGCIPAYRGFHPHMLGTTNYAFMREENGHVFDIQEKKPFTDNRMNEYASSGAYYFKSGTLLKECCNRIIRENLNVNGEFYLSLAYKPLFADKKDVRVFELEHFMQWGTPDDVVEYKHWSQVFEDLNNPAYNRSDKKFDGTLLLPMAGAGSRFAQEGYTTPKPLIPVSGKPMVIQAARDLPQMEEQVFIVRKDLPGVDGICDEIKKEYPKAQFVSLEALTEGQACTCLMGMESIAPEKPMTIGACDNGMLFDAAKFEALMNDDETDVILWAVRGYPGAKIKPQGYGWIKAEGDNVTGMSVKVPLEDPSRDPIVLGAFTFKRADDFKKCASRLIERDGRVNGEFFVDSCMEDALALGLKVKLFEVKQYLCWGTPNDYKTFQYWQDCFEKWESHPYRKVLDTRFASS